MSFSSFGRITLYKVAFFCGEIDCWIIDPAGSRGSETAANCSYLVMGDELWSRIGLIDEFEFDVGK